MCVQSARLIQDEVFCEHMTTLQQILNQNSNSMYKGKEGTANRSQLTATCKHCLPGCYHPRSLLIVVVCDVVCRPEMMNVILSPITVEVTQVVYDIRYLSGLTVILADRD